MDRIFAAASLALLLDIAAVGQQPQPVAKGFRGAFVAQPILNVLAAAGATGSIQYSAECGPNVYIPDLPLFREPQKPYPANPVDTLRAMFSIDSRIAVSQGRNGVIRVVEAGVQTDILGVRIDHLSFDRTSDPDEALNVVLGAPEVQSFMQAHGIGEPFFIYSAPLYELPGLKHIPPTPGVRSISGELNDVTLADALDYILKTFPGFWLYQDCETPDQQRVVYFDLFPAPGRMWLWEDGTTLVR
ncbi:MAG TPA: hypothetical protein VMD99_15120 [Terriglobales bacterium]|nr:hypothetical protein [Terriglobales bacterium]